MVQRFADKYIEKKEEFKQQIRDNHPKGYHDLVEKVVLLLQPDSGDEDYYESMDSTRIECIDHGDYQGTLVFVIGAVGYQPSMYWVATISYGSCSACDTMQRILEKCDYNYDDDTKVVPEDAVDDFWTMGLHFVQSLKEV